MGPLCLLNVLFSSPGQSPEYMIKIMILIEVIRANSNTQKIPSLKNQQYNQYIPQMQLNQTLIFIKIKVSLKEGKTEERTYH